MTLPTKLLCLALIIMAVVCGLASVLACMNQDYYFAVYSLVSGILCGLCVVAHPKDDPKSDPCIPAEWASDEILKENLVISEFHPADWQIEEVMTIRWESYLRGLWRQLKDEWDYDPAAVASYDDGLVTGFAIAVQKIACKFDIDLEKP